MEIMLAKRKNSLPLTYFNMLGLGPMMMQALIKKTKIPSIEELFNLVKELKITLFI